MSARNPKHAAKPRRLGLRFGVIAGSIATFAAITAVNAPAAQAQEEALDGWVSLNTPSTVTAGDTTTIKAIAGVEGQAAADETIYLHYWADNQWHYYTSKKADSSGRTQFSVKANETTDFRAVLSNDAGDDYKAVSYDVRLNVNPRPAAPAAPAPSVAVAPQAYDGSRGSQVVALAAAEAGKPYVYGAAGPYGFDCSGLVQHVFSQVGLWMPHSATAQGSYGYAVSQGEAQPGDLILFGSPGNYYHIGISAGGNMMWAAPQPGDVIKLQSIWTNSYEVRRVL